MEVSWYNYACVVPVVQQAVGGVTVIKNVIGLIKDIANSILSSFESFEMINAKINLEQIPIYSEIKNLELIQKSNENLEKTTRDITINLISTPHKEIEFKKIYDLAIQNLEEQQVSLKLSPLSGDDRRILESTNLGFGIDISQDNHYKKYHEVRMQIGNKISNLNIAYVALETKKTVPIGERIKNIALGTISATPVLGTLFNLGVICYGRKN